MGRLTMKIVCAVPLLSHLSKENKMRFLDVFEQKTFEEGEAVIKEGDPGENFYIIKSGEATVYQNVKDEAEGVVKTRRINQLFPPDFFGEAALLTSSKRQATVIADTKLVCLTLNKNDFMELMAPMEELMLKEKSPHVVGARLMKMASSGGPSRQPAMVHIKRRRYSHSQGQWVW